MLSNGAFVSPEIAVAVINHPSVVACGDCLFKGGPSQTFRYADWRGGEAARCLTIRVRYSGTRSWGRDEYDTPLPALTALLRVENLGPRVRAFGNHALVGAISFCRYGKPDFEVIAADISDRGCPDCAIADVFDSMRLPDGCDVGVTNPPYYCVERFVRHMLALRPRLLILLLRLAFMESRRRADILEGAGLARIHVFDRRLPMMHRASWTGKKANSGMAFGWFV